MDQGTHGHPRQERASAPDARGHGPSDRWTLAPKRWSPAFAGRGGQEAAHAPIRWVSCPLVHAPTSGPYSPLRAASARPGTTPTALQLWWGLGSAWAAGEYGVPRPCLAAACCAAAGPNPHRGLLVLGWLASLR